MIKKLIQDYKNFRKAEQKRKQIFLFEQAKADYYRQLQKSPLLTGEGKGEVSIPQCLVQIQLKRLAYTLALKELRKVIAECRVNECYKKCLKMQKGTVNA